MPDWFNTNELRFIERLPEPRPRVGTSDGDVNAVYLSRKLRILQQRWVLTGTLMGDDLTDKNSEWRDVPLVEEAAKGTNVVACGCGWSGQQDGLVETAGVRSCPDCGAAFNSYRLEHHPSGVKF